MINVNSYIKLILNKKKWSNTKLCQEINKIEKCLGDSKTSNQNITNYLNGYYSFRPKILAKWEKALELPQGTLINMVQPPSSKDGKKELQEVIKKLNKMGEE